MNDTNFGDWTHEKNPFSPEPYRLAASVSVLLLNDQASNSSVEMRGYLCWIPSDRLKLMNCR